MASKRNITKWVNEHIRLAKSKGFVRFTLKDGVTLNDVHESMRGRDMLVRADVIIDPKWIDDKLVKLFSSVERKPTAKKIPWPIDQRDVMHFCVRHHFTYNRIGEVYHIRQKAVA